MERTSYFMIRVRRLGDAPEAPMAGVVEQIDSGRKQAFGSGDELLRLLRELSGPRHTPADLPAVEPRPRP